MAPVFYTIWAAADHFYPGHPESPQRVQAAQAYLESTLQLRDCAEACELREYGSVTEAQLAAVHDQAYIDSLRTSLAQVSEPTALRDLDDPDGCTFATATTWSDALRAASSAVALMDAILGQPPSDPGPTDGSSGSSGSGSGVPSSAAAGGPANTRACGFSLCRPPGHHATPSEGMGFCLLNSAAVAARHAQRAHGLQRVMILDWDVHHGNGTQDIFYEDPTVLFIDIHQAEVWPGSGALEEAGAGPGAGSNINVPLPWHSGHAAVQRVFERVVAPAARRFCPEMIIVSAGYDAHWRDPLEHLQFQSATYHWLAAAVRGLAEEVCGGRCLLVLEGGYHLEAVAESVGESMLGLLGRPPATSAAPCAAMPGHEPEPLAAVEAVIEQVRQLHGLLA